MDLFPLFNSVRIALISSVLVFFTGIIAAYYARRLPRVAKGVLDVVLTLPLVLPPTVVGYFLLMVFGLKRPVGMFLAEYGIRLVMTWPGGVAAAFVVSFPLMYRTARGAFESFNEDLAEAGRTLGLSGSYIFWHITMPYCRDGILAGTVLHFLYKFSGRSAVFVPQTRFRLCLSLSFRNKYRFRRLLNFHFLYC